MVPILILALFASYPADVVLYQLKNCNSIICRDDQWMCQTSCECIHLHGKCDSKIDCKDGSDESHAVCRNIIRCPRFTFHCTYGACVDDTAVCNGTPECLDRSDEVHCGPDHDQSLEVNGIFQCSNGDRIPSYDLCDGRVHCADGSDETLAACARPRSRCAPNLFQCRYGACVDADAACDPYGTLHCADGSDEAEELCKIKANRPSTTCTLPEYPTKGNYRVLGHENTEPGQSFSSIDLLVSCEYPNNTSWYHYASCFEGLWKQKINKCTSFCKVPTNEGTKYECGYYPCTDYLPNGVTIYPKCMQGYRKIEAQVMTCMDGDWDRKVKCEKETQNCGLPSAAQQLMIGGAAAKLYEMPWHAGIYDTSSGKHEQICGGSLVSRQLVISAAHCFWNDVKHQLPHTNYAVALGQLGRQWNIGQAQLFNVSSIVLPPTFRGETTMYRADIALVFLDKPAEYRANVQPVCLVSRDQKHTTDGKLGKVAGWGLTAEEGRASDELIVNDFPTVSNSKCINESHPDFVRYIDDGKLCAGNLTGNALCEGDSGGGLVFRDGPGQPYYLHGVASIRYKNQHKCNKEGYTTFTRVSYYYDEFIVKYSNGTL